MNPDRAERQTKFIAIAAVHAEDFKTRVAQHDRENSFAHENVAAMKASGYTNMVAPAELGAWALGGLASRLVRPDADEDPRLWVVGACITLPVGVVAALAFS